MQMIKYVESFKFPDDNFTKELVYLEIDGKRFGYVLKLSKSGAEFWDEISVGVTVQAEKKYFKAFKFDSQFLRDDILTFLKERAWESRSPTSYAPSVPLKQIQDEQLSFLDTCPF